MGNWFVRLGLIGFVLLVLQIFLALMGVPSPALEAAKVQVNYFSELKTMSDVLTLVQKKYVDEEPASDRNKLIEGGIEGILKKLDDPFSRYMPPDTFKNMQEETDGEFGGLGILLGARDGFLTVISPMEGTPAFRAGIRSQDKLIKINGTPTEGMDVEDAVKLLRGKPGTKVTISLARTGAKDLVEYVLEREQIKVPSVKAGKLSTEIGYARLTNFAANTGRDLDEEIQKMEENGNLQGMILDLRGNPGGLLTAAVEVAQDLLGNGKRIVSVKGREGEETVFSSESTKIRTFPLIVLIDSGSASASEIVAGALKDNKRAMLLGTKSFGKGSVQTVLPLQDGAGLALTTAYYYTPAGIKIHKIGILPDLELPFPNLNDDQLRDYRDEMERITNRDYQKTSIRQENFLKSSGSSFSTAGTTSTPFSLPSTSPMTSVTSSGAETITTSEFVTIPKFDIQLQRAFEILKASHIFQSLPKF